MDKAKAAVSDFMSKSGHHDTTVHEKVAPAVVNENITQKRHEEATTAIDREVHQDHYHTSVQPVKDREVLPEKHAHSVMDVEERHHQHGNPESVKARLEQEAAQFQGTRQVRQEESHSVAPVIAGEHVHHHVHETIQPVVQKETIQPSVVHTTVPIHEIHENEAKHHSTSALPAVSMADFKKQGGSLTGREERYDGFEGEPRAVGGALGGSSHSGSGMTGGSTTAGPHHSNMENKMDPRVDSDMDGRRGVETGSGRHDRDTAGSGYGSGTAGAGYGSGATGTGYGSTNAGPHSSSMENKVDPRVDSDMDGRRGVETGSGRHGRDTAGAGYGSGAGYDDTTTGTHQKKGGFMDKLNPKKDGDGDGKTGFMK